MQQNLIVVKPQAKEQTKEILYFHYQVELASKTYFIEDFIFRDHVFFIDTLKPAELFNFIMNRCSVVPVELFKEFVRSGLSAQKRVEITDDLQASLSKLILEATDSSIQKAYEVVSKIEDELRRMLFLHQVTMVDHCKPPLQRVQNLQCCIDYLKSYDSQNQSKISEYVRAQIQFILNDKYRLLSSANRKDLCQQTLVEFQGYQENLPQTITEKLIKAQVDLLQSDYVFQLQQKVSVNLNCLVGLLDSLKVIDVYDNNQKLHQCPVIVERDGWLAHRVSEPLKKLVQLVYAALQMQEITLLCEKLVNLQPYFSLVSVLQIRYVYHLCLSQCLQKEQALEQSVKAYELALEINDISDIVEIVINTQLLFIEAEEYQKGIQFTKQFLQNNKLDQSQFKSEVAVINDNLTFMSVAVHAHDN